MFSLSVFRCMKFHFVKWFSFAVLTIGVIVLSPVFAQTSSLPTNTFCATSSICASTPQEFLLLIDLARELTLSMKTIGTKSPYLGKYVNPNRFQ
jgi:hypothetical protein